MNGSDITIGKACLFVVFELYGHFLHWAIVPQVRSVLLRLFGARVGRGSVIFDISLSNAFHYGLSRLDIGKRCFVGDGVLLDVRGGITLEDEATVSSRVCIVTHMNVGFHDHPLQTLYPTSEKGVTIGQGAYVGTAAVILPGVRVGRGSVVAAGAVVTRDVPPGCMVAGVPARRVKDLGPKPARRKTA